MSRSTNQHPILCDYCCHESLNENKFVEIVSKEDKEEVQHICRICWSQMDMDEIDFIYEVYDVTLP